MVVHNLPVDHVGADDAYYVILAADVTVHHVDEQAGVRVAERRLLDGDQYDEGGGEPAWKILQNSGLLIVT